MRSCRLTAPGTNPGYERAYRIWGGRLPMSSRRGQRRHKLSAACTPRAATRFARALHMHASQGRSIAANERGAFNAGGRAAAIHSGTRSREIIQILWPAEQTLVARASCEKDRADTDAGGFATVDRCLDFTRNPAV